MSLQPVSGATKIAPESNLYLDVTDEGSDLPDQSRFSVAGPDLKQLENGYNYTATTHARPSSKDDDDKKKDDDSKSTSSRSESSSKSSEPKTQERSSSSKSSSEKGDKMVTVPVVKEDRGDDDTGQPGVVTIGGKAYAVQHERDSQGAGYIEIPKDPHARNESERTTRYPVFDPDHTRSDDVDPDPYNAAVNIPQSEIDKLEEESKDKDD